VVPVDYTLRSPIDEQEPAMSSANAIPRNALSTLRIGLLCLALACLGAAGTPSTPKEDSVRPGVNERFLSEALDVERFVGIFEGESREVSVQREQIAKALAVSPGMTVADIGAGTGLFLPDFDRGVGSEGRVYAVEISPKFLEHLRERAKREKLARVEVVEALEDSVALPAASVDLAFVCDTYHHFEFPQSTLASLYTAIRPGGSLVILDFDRIPGKSRPWVLEHVRAGKEVFRREIESAGFRFERQVTVEGLKENYVLRFRRP
jgi:ubiquinone/menaquinone biosynthesis C-methylase UbiE